MKRSLLSLLLIMANIAVLQAQMSINVNPPFYLWNSDDVQKIKTKILLVQLETEDPATLKRLAKKPGELQWYKEQVAGKNEAIRYAVEHFWNFSSEKVFAPAGQVAGMMKSGKYVLLQFGDITIQTRERTGTGYDGRPSGWRTENGQLMYNMDNKKLVPFDQVTTLQIVVPGKDYGAIITNMPTNVPCQADAVYGIQQLQYVLRYVDGGNKIKNIEKQYALNHPELKTKTLLIDQQDLDDKVTAETIKSIYPYPFEITTTGKISQAILDKDNRYAFVQLVPMAGSKGVIASHFVCSAEDGKIYATVEKKAALTVVGGTIGTKLIKEKHVKEYASL